MPLPEKDISQIRIRIFTCFIYYEEPDVNHEENKAALMYTIKFHITKIKV